MKNLREHINEALRINKNFKGASHYFDNKLNNLVDEYIMSTQNHTYELGDCIVYGTGTIYNDLGVSLSDNDLDKAFGKDDINKCKEIAIEMFKFGDVYRFLFGRLYNDNISIAISEFFDNIQKSDIEFNTIFFDTDKQYSVEYYKTNEYMLLTFGSEKFSYLFLSVRN